MKKLAVLIVCIIAITACDNDIEEVFELHSIEIEFNEDNPGEIIQETLSEVVVRNEGDEAFMHKYISENLEYELTSCFNSDDEMVFTLLNDAETMVKLPYQFNYYDSNGKEFYFSTRREVPFTSKPTSTILKTSSRYTSSQSIPAKWEFLAVETIYLLKVTASFRARIIGSDGTVYNHDGTWTGTILKNFQGYTEIRPMKVD